jgi:CheY-like chemotaxis protein
MATDEQRAGQAGAGGENPALRLLVVEDHGDLCAALELLLPVLGCRPRIARDMAAAIHAASEESFDVLLSDIALPDGSGWDLLRRLEEAGHRPRYAIAMSCHGQREDLDRSEAAGFAAHLVKPFPPQDLEKVLLAARFALAA